MQVAKAVVHQPIAASVTAALSYVDNHIASVPLGYKRNNNVSKHPE